MRFSIRSDVRNVSYANAFDLVGKLNADIVSIETCNGCYINAEPGTILITSGDLIFDSVRFCAKATGTLTLFGEYRAKGYDFVIVDPITNPLPWWRRWLGKLRFIRPPLLKFKPISCQMYKTAELAPYGSFKVCQ